MLALYGFLNPMDSCPIYGVDSVKVEALWIILFVLKPLFETPLPKRNMLCLSFSILEKTYDTTWKYGILKDLFDMRLKGKLFTFISNFLSDREFNVRVNSIYSDIQEQEIGVPQGGILSVTLLGIQINSLAKVLNDNIDGSLSM